jgi:hypothetical protein
MLAIIRCSVLSTNRKIKTYRTVILSVVFYGCETWSHTLKEEHKLRVFENRALRMFEEQGNRVVEKTT